MRPQIFRLGALALLVAVPIAGCSTQGAGTGTLPSAPVTSGKTKPPVPLVYVANMGDSSTSGRPYVSIFNATTGKVKASIRKGILTPTALAFDASGNLYVANQVGSSSSWSSSGSPFVSVFEPGGTKLLRSITRGITVPVAIAVDGKGDVFVANYTSFKSGSEHGGNVTEYKAGTTRLVRTITDGVTHPIALDTDAAGNLYVLNAASGSSSSSSSGASVTVYGAGQFSLTRTVTNGIENPTALAVDAQGDFAVGNAASGGSSSSSSSGPSPSPAGVAEYVSGSSSPATTLTNGIVAPRALAFDAAGSLYVLNGATGGSWSSSCSCSTGGSNGSVSVYASGSTTPNIQIAKGISDPAGFAVESNGAVFVADVSPCPSCSNLPYWVTEYASHSTAVRRTITSHVLWPSAIAVH